MIVPMTSKHAVTYLSWQYAELGTSYNTPEKDIHNIVAEILCGISDWFAVLDEEKQMIGIYQFTFMPSGLLEFGLNLAPEKIGKKLGTAFVQQGITYAKQLYPDYQGPISLRVWDQNKRAIALYTKLGFKITGTEQSSHFDSNSAVTFICMQKRFA